MTYERYPFQVLKVLSLVFACFGLFLAVPSATIAQTVTTHTESFNSGFTTGTNVGAHADWYDGGSGPVVTTGVGTNSSIGLVDAGPIFIWSAHPFDWNDPDFIGVNIQMDFESNSVTQDNHFNDDRVGWMIYDDNTGSDHIFGVQFDDSDNKIEGYWDGATSDRRPLITNWFPSRSTWYRLRMEVTKLTATSAQINVIVDQLNSDGTVFDDSVAYGEIANTAALGDDAPNSKYFTPDNIWAGYKNYNSGSDGDADNAVLEIITAGGGPTVDVWYGESQEFGLIGNPQRSIDILGNVSDPDGVSSIVYSLNGAADSTLTIGPDSRRLESTGDFCIDINTADLIDGANEVIITATDGAVSPNETVVTVDVTYHAGNVWPIPYSIDWSAVTEILDSAQVVDGSWELEADAVRTTITGYDRLVAFGDTTWQDYEVEVPITIHSLDPSGAVGILMRWEGHTDLPAHVADMQPKTGWLPLGAILRYKGSNELDIYANGTTVASTSRTLTPETTYIFKGRVATNATGGLYKFKVWEEGTTEPTSWDLTAQEGMSDPQNGSALLFAHFGDASFGDVDVTAASALDEGWVAFNDMNTTAADANASYVTLNDYNTSTVTLKDSATGSTIPVISMTGAWVNGFDPKTSNGGPCNPGTDAATFFGAAGSEIVDLVGPIELDATNWDNIITFDNLDPTRQYDITLTANRDNPDYIGARFAKVTIEGADTYTNASSSGVVVNSSASVSFSVGYNTVNGYVARWTHVTSGPDGTFSVKSEWDDAQGSGEYNTKGYSMGAFRLEESIPGPQHTLTVATVGNGTVVKLPDQATYDLTSVVQLTAVADPGWLFDSWSGDLTGNTNPQDLTITGDMNVTATFVELPETEWTAYNDLAPAATDPAGDFTAYTTVTGNSLANPSGLLVDSSDGSSTGVTLTVTGGNYNAGSHSDTQTGSPTSGTDAHDIFGTFINALGTISYVDLASPDGDLVLTFTGMNPGALYNLVFYGHRDDYSWDRAALATLSGADAFANNSSAATDNPESGSGGALYSGPDDPSTRLPSDNDNGYVARFSNVDPGADGEVVLTLSFGGTSGNEYRGKYANAVMLEQAVTEAPPTMTCEDFESGFTLGQDVGTHADWFDGGNGPHVTGGIGVASSVGLAPANNIFIWTANPFDWSAPDFEGVNLQMDFQTDGSAHFDDDRIGWMITDDDVGSSNIFGLQLDPGGDGATGQNIEAYWDGVTFGDDGGRTSIANIPALSANSWYRFRAEITKLSATSASIDVTLTELDGAGNEGAVVVSDGIADTDLLTGNAVPNAGYFTASSIWPAFKNYTAVDGAADNACFEVLTGAPQHTLTVTIVGNGSVDKLPDQATYDLSDVVQLTANADPGWVFDGWSVDLTGSTNPENITITGDMNVTATFVESAPPTMTCEDFESGFTLGQDVGTHADWFDGGDGPHVTTGIGVAGSVGLAPANNIFTWTAQPFDWNAPGFEGVNLQMDFQTDGSAHFDDDRIGWMITDASAGSDNIFGLQLDPGGSGYNIEAYWDGDSFGDNGGRTSITDLPALTANGWYRFRAEITKLTATSASIDVTLTALDGAGNEGAVVASGSIPDTDLLPNTTGEEIPNPGYFTAATIWPAFKNYTTAGAAADNACFEILTGVPTQHTLTVSVVGNGSVDKLPDQALYDLSDVVQLTANADPGWVFQAWSVDLTGSTNPDNITITGDMNVTATFVEAPTIAAGDVIISGIQSWNNPSTQDPGEFIELFNTTDAAISLETMQLISRTDNGTPDGVLDIDWQLAVDLTGASIAPHSFFLIAESGVAAPSSVHDVETDMDLATGEGGSTERAIGVELIIDGVHMDHLLYGRHDGSSPAGEIPAGDRAFDGSSWPRTEVIRNTTGETSFREGLIWRETAEHLYAGYDVEGYYTDETALGDGYPDGVWTCQHDETYGAYEARNSTSAAVAPPPSELFAFVVATDFHTSVYQSNLEDNLQQIKYWVDNPTPEMPAPEFMVVTGDFPHAWQTEESIDDVLGTDFLWYPVVGNHEISDGMFNFYYVRDTLVPTLPDVVNYGPTGSVNTQYSWEFGNAHFVSINSYWNGTTAAGADYAADGIVPPALRDWIAADLVATSATHRFAFIHEPAFPDHRHVGDALDADTASRNAFLTMLSDNGVQSLFSGHTHYYEHNTPAEFPELGTVHEVTNAALRNFDGQGGASITYVLVGEDTTTYTVYNSTTGYPFAFLEQWKLPDGAAPTQHTLTVNTVGNGSVYKLPDQALYDLSDVVQLTADPDPGWVFDGWSGDLTGSTNPENITITGNMNVTATFVETAPPSMTCEDFESGFTLGQDVGNHAQWFDGADDEGSDVLAGIGVAGSIGLAPGNTIFTWTAHPFDWNAADFQSIILEMDFQASPTGTFDDDRMGWMITDSDNGSANIFGVQLDDSDGGIVTYWRNSIGTRIQDPIVALSGITANTWYNFHAQITKLSATSASIDVTLTELDGSGSPVGIVASGSLANTDSVGDDKPDTYYFTAATMWPAYKNYQALAGAADNACFAIVTGAPPTEHTLTVTTVGNGSVDKDPDQALYYLGSSVQLTAIADPGWVFDSWSGDLTGSTNPDDITIAGDMNVTATFVEQPPFTDVCEDFESGFTLGAELRTHADWFYETANSGPVPQAGIGVAGSIGLTNGDRAFTWTAHPFNWNDPTLDGVYFQMDFQTDGAGHFDDDRIGWTISDTDDGSDNIFGVQMDPKGSSTTVYNIEAYWDGDTFGDNGGRSSIVDLPTLSGNSWYRLRAEIYKLTAGSARIEVFLTGLDGAGNDTGLVVSGTLANTALLPNTTDEEIPNPAYFTPTTMWPVYKNYDAIGGAVDNTCSGILTGTPPTEYTLTVTTVGSGYVDKLPDQAFYDLSDVVQLTAYADPGWTFGGWSGDLTGNTNPDDITITGDMDVIATFYEEVVETDIDHVIVISVDGLRADALDALTGLDADSIPNLMQLRAGSSTLNARTPYTHTVTLPCHVSILTSRPVLGTLGHLYTGNSDPAPGVTLHTNHPTEAYVYGMYDVAHDNGVQTGLFVSKSKLSLFEVSWPDKTDFYSNSGDVDGVLLPAAITHLTGAAGSRSLALFHDARPDDAGHSGGWDITPLTEQYAQSIITFDKTLGVIMDTIRGNSELNGHTAIILTADHGGSGTSHSDVSNPDNYTVPFLVWLGDGYPTYDLYALNPVSRTDPIGRPTDVPDPDQPIRNADAGNLALDLLGLPPIPNSGVNAAMDLEVLPATLPPAECEDFESGFTLGAELRTHPDWFYETANSGPVPQAGIGVAGSVGLTTGDRAFTWTAHPFNWNDPSLDGVYFQMDFQTDGAGHFDDDRIGWTISDTDDGSGNIFGVQMDPGGSGYNIETYWDGDAVGDDGGRWSIVDLPTLPGNSWYRLRAEIYKLTAGSARIEVTLTALDGAGNEGGVVASGVLPDTDLLPNTAGEEIPNPAYFTPTTMWPVYKNFTAVDGAVDNTCFGIITGGPGLDPEISDCVLAATSPANLTSDDLLCSYSLGGSATTAATAWYLNSAPQMVLYLPMEGGTTNARLDYSGFGNHSTASGSPTWGASSGHDGFGAFQLDGTDHLIVPDDASLDVDYVTLMAWVYLNEYADDQRIISKEYGTSQPYSIYTLNMNGPLERNLEMRLGLVGQDRIRVRTDAEIPLNTWVHVAGTFDGSQVRLYINGILEETQAVTGVLRHNGEPVYVGGSQFYADRTFHGRLDDARIYGFALSPEQILAYHDTGRDIMVSQETTIGQVWHADITPFSATEAGSLCQTNTLTIQSAPTAPVITSTPVLTAYVDQLYNYDVDATGTPPLAYSLTTSPAGMSINPTTGLISWTPTVGQVGDHPVTVQVSNVGGSTTQSYTVSVTDPTPNITSVPVTTAIVGVPYSYDVDATGFPAPTYSLTTNPAGMTIDGTSGIISWTPTIGQLGSNSVVVVATNTAGTDDQSFDVIVTESPDCVLAATSPGNLTTDDLICTYGLSGGMVTAATAWYLNSAPQMVLYLPMEGGATNALLDYSGLGNNSTASGSPTWGAGIGHDGFGAFQFDGTDHLVVSDDASLDVNYVTLMAWIYVNEYVDDQRIISKEYGTSQPYSIYTLNMNGPVERNLEMRLGLVGQDRIRVRTDAEIPLNTWVHVAGTFNGSQVRLYINGILEETQAVTGVLRHNDAPVYVGGSQFYTARTFHGRLDDARIYGYALSPEQILAYHNTGRDIMVSQETTIGQVWHADITPFSATEAGTLCQTNALTIQEATAAPLISSTAVTSATVDVAYSYNVDATGQPAPTYSLTTSPTGMSINPTTGLISWIPNSGQVGDHPVTVVATNASGTDDQSFDVSVAEAPECTVTATSLDNSTSDSLICNYSLTGGQVTAATAWYQNGAPQMALYLPFEGGVANSLNDYSGNGNDAGAVGSPSWNATTGHDGFGAMTLNGASDHLVVPDNSTLDVDYVTLMAWIYVGSYQDDQRIISKEYGDSQPYSIYTLLMNGPLERNLEMRVGLVGQDRIRVRTTDEIPLDTWVHVAGTFDGSQIRLYINGLLEETGAASGVLRHNDEPVYVGASQFWPRFFDGNIDDTRIYGSALSDEQIRAYYQLGRDLIVPQETSVADEWRAHVTPFSATAAGPMCQTNILTIEPPTVAASVDVSEQLPDQYNLHANYPNPFNPTTEIGFDLPDAVHVRLEIYNIMGQRVTTLIDSHREAGYHSVTWDGSQVASGVYLYRLEAGVFVDTKKMVMLK